MRRCSGDAQSRICKAIALDPRIASRLETSAEVLRRIAQLRQRATHGSVHWQVTAIETRLQSEADGLRRRQDYEIDSSNVLELFDLEIKRAGGDAAQVAKFLDLHGRDAAWPS